jgi:hypothetical protein|tara:strand:+ start:5135 stop:5338 length:204 start_codon:yes stop_codon:yes gene_type:complete
LSARPAVAISLGVNKERRAARDKKSGRLAFAAAPIFAMSGDREPAFGSERLARRGGTFRPGLRVNRK